MVEVGRESIPSECFWRWAGGLKRGFSRAGFAKKMTELCGAKNNF